MLDLKRIGLFTRGDSQDYQTGKLGKLFKRAGIALVPDAAAAEPGTLDLIIAMGGDGTVLRALRAHPGTPVLAVNFGTVGFLTQSDREHLDNVLVRLLSDDYMIDDRLTLDITHQGATHYCINEVVLKGLTRMIEVQVSINGRRVHTPRGDGIIVGTPTGSTAYLLSTGAPFITPDVDCIVVKPLNEYSITSRSIIVPGGAEVVLDLVPGRETDVTLVIDGNHRMRVHAGDRITLRRSPVPARLVYFEPDYFFRNLRERLRW